MEINDYYQLAKDTLSEYRYTHSSNVARAAVELARRFCADEKKAETAGILHDITKEMPVSKQLQIISDNGIILDIVTRNTPRILHAVSACAYCDSVLGITDTDILNAVRYHTTARSGMSLLEKCVFVADFISDDRTYSDINEMRHQASISLESGMKYALTYVIGSLINSGRPVHPDAIDSYNELIMKGSFK